jgi:hypothetical protein
MKRAVLPVVVLAMIGTGFFPDASAAPNPVTVRVEQANKVSGGKTSMDKFIRHQHRTLTVFVTNGAAETAQVLVKYTIFGREVTSREVVTIEHGERAATVAARTTATVETSKATATSEDEHFKGKKKIEAAGNKIIGHGVQVWQGEAVVAEVYEPPGIKEHWGKAVPAAKHTRN